MSFLELKEIFFPINIIHFHFDFLSPILSFRKLKKREMYVYVCFFVEMFIQKNCGKQNKNMIIES